MPCLLQRLQPGRACPLAGSHHFDQVPEQLALTDTCEMRFKFLLLACLAGISFNGHAQVACPTGWIPYSATSCGPAPSAQEAPVQRAPTVSWESRWGAIAVDGPKGILGTASNVLSEKQAKSTALSECKAKGGVDCILQVSYSNSCGVMVVGDKGYNTNAAPTLKEATAKGMSMCGQSDTNCQVYYSDCSLPKRIR